MNKKFVGQFLVLKNKPLNKTNSYLKLKCFTELPEIKPGQFVNIEIQNSDQIFLRRPFSVFEVDHFENTISLIVKKLGRGSTKLTEIAEGETLSIVYPLGKGFTLPEKEDRILFVGGGSGIAPLLFLAKRSKLSNNNVDLILGAKTHDDHIDVSSYSDYCKFHFSTDDGSFGEKGFVTGHSLFLKNLTEYDKIYTCGPDAMMKSVAREAARAGIFCEVSLENLMACGFGVCLCCIEPTTKGNLCVCTEGPVFNLKELKWEI